MKVFCVDMRIPQPDRNAGDWIINQYLHLFVDAGCSVTYWPHSRCLDGIYSTRLMASGIQVVVERSFEKWIARNTDVDVVILARPFTMDYIEHVRKHTSARILYFAHDLHFVREQREANAGLRDGKDLYFRKYHELYMMVHSDVTIVLSSAEKAKMDSIFPHLDCRVWPWVQPVHKAVSRKPGSARLVFLGGFGHPPNIDAATWMVEDVMPLIAEQIPGAHLSIVGSESQRLGHLEGKNVTVLGQLPVLDKVFAASDVFVCPLRWGAGFKGKIAMALSYGLPVVTTSIGAEGMDINGACLVADTPKGFADNVVLALSNNETWNRLSTRGQEVTQQRWSESAALEAIKSAIEV